MIARRPQQVAKRARRDVAPGRVARRERRDEATFTIGDVVDDPVADVLDTKPDKVDPKYRSNHDIFITMLRAGTSPDNERFTVEGVLTDWWSHAFPGRHFPPPEGGYANELALAVQYGLLMQGYERYDIVPPERFKRNHDAAVALRFGDLSDRLQAVLDFEEKTALGQKFIKPKQGAEQWQRSSERPPSALRRKSVPLQASQPSAPNPKPVARRPLRGRTGVPVKRPRRKR